MIHGVLLLDKPVGRTSNAALQAAKRLFRSRKAGHGGTLDPLASGLLPVLFGEATKFAHGALDADKEYLPTVCLGVATDTGDAEGKVIQRKDVSVSDQALQTALRHFRGEIEQVPPMHSALRCEGRRLYELARAGRTVERKPRVVTISGLELLSRSGNTVELQVRCSKGTYIRTLAEDLGKTLGCGAHLAALRRTAVGRLRVEDAATLDELEAADESRRRRFLLPPDALLDHLPEVRLGSDDEWRVRRGQSARDAGAALGACRLYGVGGEFLGLGRGAANGVHPVRLVSERADRALK